MYSITLQNAGGDNVITSGDILGRINFAVPSESDGAAATYIASQIYAQAEGSFTSASNPASLILATSSSDSAPATGRLKVSSDGHLVPLVSGQYDLGSPNYHFRNIYADNIIGDYSGQLDGNLDLNNYDIVGTGNITIDGNVTAEYFYGDLDGVVITECRNDTGSTIAEGTPVYVSGYYSSNGKPLVAPADCANAAKMPAIGLLASELTTGSEGHVHVFGLAQNLPSAVTNGFSVGNTVYVDNGGGLTNVRPTGVSELVQNIGRVLKTGNNGRILVLGPGRSNDVPNSGHFEQLTVDGYTALAVDNGNVGIGTATPDLTGNDKGLHIHATNYPEIKLTNDTTGSTSDDGSIIQVVNSEFRFTNREDGKNISFYAFDTGGTSRQKLLLSESYIVVNGAGIDTDFQVKGENDDHLIYTDAKNDKVGIGTATPSAKLNVENGNVVFNDLGGNYDFRVEGDGETHLFQTDANKKTVGIGQSDPTYKLYVKTSNSNLDEDGLFIRGVGVDPAVMFMGQDTNESHITAKNNGILELNADIFSGAGGSAITFNVDDSEVMRVDYQDRVGIGTASPETKLDVRSTIQAKAAGVKIQSVDSSVVVKQQAYSAGNVGILGTESNHNLEFRANNIGYMYLTTSGDVGIGTATPNTDTKMEVSYDPTSGPYGLMVTKDGQETTDGVVLGDCLGTTYQGLSHVTQDPSALEYMIISQGGSTFISANDGYDAIIRAGANSTNYQLRIKPASAEFGSTGDLFKLNSAGAIFNDGGANLDFRVEGDTLTHLIHADASKDEVVIHNAIGYPINYATSEGWVEATGGTSSQVGYYGGNFTSNGASAKNYINYSDLPNGLRGLVWQSRNNTSDNTADGGWTKEIYGLDPAKTYISVVYVRRVSSDANSTVGYFYHGAKSGSSTYNLDNTVNGNPYFHAFSANVLPYNVWCVSIGVIHANGDPVSSSTGIGGVYRLDTGARINGTTTDYRMGPNVTSQNLRTFLYYDTAGTTELDWCWPGFYEINSSAAVNLLNTILYDHFGGRNITVNEDGGNFDFRVEGGGDPNLLFTDASTDKVGIGTLTPLSKLHVRDTTDSDCQIVVDNGTARAKLQTLSNIGYVGTITDHDFILRSNNIDGIKLSNSASNNIVVVNPTANDQDFRVRGSGETNLIYVDASTNNVGIGIGAPTQRLHVYEAGNAQVLVDDGTVKTKVQSLAGQSKGIVGTNSNHDLEFRTNNNGKMIIKAVGDVGIGTASPSYKLDVAGSGSFDALNINDQFTFPTTDGSADQVLVTNGSGALTWQDQQGAASSSNYIYSLIFR